MVSQGGCSSECARKNRKEGSVPATRDSELLNDPIQIFFNLLYNPRLLGSPSEIWESYGVATISRLLKILGLFCKRAL